MVKWVRIRVRVGVGVRVRVVCKGEGKKPEVPPTNSGPVTLKKGRSILHKIW